MFGKELCLLEDCCNLIIYKNFKKKTYKKINLIINKKKDLEKISIICNENDLFNKRKIITIILKKENYTDTLYKKIIIFIQKITKNFFIIVILNFSIKKKNNSIFNTKIKKGVIIDCNIVNKKRSLQWINYKEKFYKLYITIEAKTILYEFYYGNFLLLIKMFEFIKLTFIKKNIITEDDLKKIIFNDSKYTSFEWINTIFSGKKIESIKILNKLKENQLNPIHLIRLLQKDLLLLIQIKSNNKIIYKFLQEKKIWKNKLNMFMRTIKLNSLNKLCKIIKLLLISELSIKNNHEYFSWITLKNICLLIN
ncbi:DNA polymerase III subunit delta [Buchnera aphidicola (Kurisakia onigurumii)]|uniref:DNA polymerase III subunit delta n=1 Tax=Buchnera aphidicola TaxID=9 RepID=UPI0031B67E89